MSIPDIVLPPESATWAKVAQSTIRRFCGWHVAPIVEETLTVDSPGGRSLTVPSGRIVELLGLTVDGVAVDVSGVDVSERGGVLTWRAGWFPDRDGVVQVRLRHGFDPVEVPEVAALIQTLAGRAASGVGLVKSQGVGGAQVSYVTASDGSPLSVQMFRSEQETLRPFRVEWTP